LLFSDGLTEAMNGAGEEFGMRRIIRTLELCQRAPKLIPALERAVLSHIGGTPQHDDRTLLALIAG
jgi:serine phosphatase RsbU (regulator of sigma subunit)